MWVQKAEKITCVKERGGKPPSLNPVSFRPWGKFPLAAVYSAKENYGALYINGNEIDRKETAADLVMQDWGQGARIGLTVDYARPFTGLIDDFIIIWNKALTPEEIRKIMAYRPTP